MEQWSKIRDDRDWTRYSVSSYGRVRNDETGRIMSITQTESGTAKIGLRTTHFSTITLSVPHLVADHFLPAPPFHTFDTPINLDGDRMNNHVDNLAWRPLWFARKYHKQFQTGVMLRTHYHPIMNLDTNEVYSNPQEAVIANGVLYNELTIKAYNSRQNPGYADHTVFPTGHVFREITE